MNGPRTERDRKIIYDRIKITDRQACWIWEGPLHQVSSHPQQQFSAGQAGYSVMIAQFLYQEAYQTNLSSGAFFHSCPLNDRCVSPLHNYPSGDCACERCLQRQAGNLTRVKPQPLFRLTYETEGAAPFQAYFTRELAARLFAQRYHRAQGDGATVSWYIEQLTLNPIFSEAVINEPSPRILLGAS